MGIEGEADARPPVSPKRNGTSGGGGQECRRSVKMNGETLAAISVGLQWAWILLGHLIKSRAAGAARAGEYSERRGGRTGGKAGQQCQDCRDGA